MVIVINTKILGLYQIHLPSTHTQSTSKCFYQNLQILKLQQNFVAPTLTLCWLAPKDKSHQSVMRGWLTHLSAEVTRPRLIRLELFTDNGELRLVGCEAEHNEIGVGSAEDVVGVGVVIGLSTLATDVVHDLVFALTLKWQKKNSNFGLLWMRINRCLFRIIF